MGEELQRAVEEREFIMQLSQPSPESEPSGQAGLHAWFIDFDEIDSESHVNENDVA